MDGSSTDFDASVRLAGLSHLLPNYETSLRKAFETATKIKAGMTRDIAPAREPGHVFRLSKEGQA